MKNIAIDGDFTTISSDVHLFNETKKINLFEEGEGEK